MMENDMIALYAVVASLVGLVIAALLYKKVVSVKIDNKKDYPIYSSLIILTEINLKYIRIKE